MATSANSQDMNLNTLTSSAAAIPASHSAKPESGQERMIRGIFGPSSPVCFAFFDHDSSCWKMSLGTFHWASDEFSETWPDSGTMRNGRAYELRTLAPRTNGSGCSLWPTAVAKDDGKTPEAHLAMKKRMGERDGTFANRTEITSLAVKVQVWPTPRSEDGESCGNHPGAVDSLTGASRLWTTPQAHDCHGPKTPAQIEAMRQKNGSGVRNLNEDVALWQTPATDSFRSRGGDRKDEMGLDQQARSFFPTPTARDWKSESSLENRNQEKLRRHTPGLSGFVHLNSLPAPATPDGPPSCETTPGSRRLWPTPTDSMATMQDLEQAQTAGNSPNRPKYSSLEKRRLNPRFVCWLLGFPIGWTEL